MKIEANYLKVHCHWHHFTMGVHCSSCCCCLLMVIITKDHDDDDDDDDSDSDNENIFFRATF